MGSIRIGLRSLLKRTGLYSRLEWSLLHRAFVSVTNPSYWASLRSELAFYRSFITPGMLVFDVGANKGFKSEVFLRLGGRVIAVEPDPQCIQVLARRFLFWPHFHLVPKALGASTDRLELYSEDRGSAFNTFSRKWRNHSHRSSVTSVMADVSTVDALIFDWGVPDFLKIDVEGFEREVLRGLTRVIPTISFEANLPLFCDETLECINTIYKLDSGYLFNASESLSAGWLTPKWLVANEMKEFILCSKRQYLEVFAFLRPPRIG